MRAGFRIGVQIRRILGRAVLGGLPEARPHAAVLPYAAALSAREDYLSEITAITFRGLRLHGFLQSLSQT
jgi:hypothetical protein